MGRPPVEYIMSKPVYSVLDTDPVALAQTTMRNNGTKKILVKDSSGNPKGVLESWKIAERDLDKKVRDIPLGKIELRPQNTNIDDIENLLRSVSAVYITAQGNQNNIIGVITSYDIYKAGY